MSNIWQIEGSGPRAYEQYLVPAIFARCAEQLLDQAALRPGDRVVDVACGTGIVTRQARARVGPAGTVAALDMNEAMLEVASASMSELPGTVEWHQADAHALPLPDADTDVCCCQQGVQFFADAPAALGEMHRVLRPGGRLALAVWRPLEHNPGFNVLVAALGRHAGAEAATAMRPPFAGPDRDELRGLASAAGFEQILIRIGIFGVRFPSAREFLRQQAASSPLAGPVSALSPESREDLIRDLDHNLCLHEDDAGITFPMQTWLVTGARPATPSLRR